MSQKSDLVLNNFDEHLIETLSVIIIFSFYSYVLRQYPVSRVVPSPQGVLACLAASNRTSFDTVLAEHYCVVREDAE